LPDEMILVQVLHNKYRIEGVLEYEDIVCLNQKLNPFIPSALRERWKGFTQKNAIRYIRQHDLRHTHATMLVLSGTDFKTISNRLGHTDIKTTMIYAHLKPENLRNAVELLN